KGNHQGARKTVQRQLRRAGSGCRRGTGKGADGAIRRNPGTRQDPARPTAGLMPPMPSLHSATFQPIIESLLDTDLYKFTMWQAMLHRHPAAQAEYRFICRRPPEYPLADLAPAIEAQIDHLCSLRFSQAELDYLGRL